MEAMKKQNALSVKKSIEGWSSWELNDYFIIISHQKPTQNNNTSLKLPGVIVEFTRKLVFFTTAKLYNVNVNVQCKCTQ